MSAPTSRPFLLALASLLALAAFVWLRTAGEDAGAPRSADTRETRRDDAAAAILPVADPVAETRNAVVGARTLQAEESAAELTTLRGRCVAAEDGRPLAGIQV